MFGWLKGKKGAGVKQFPGGATVLVGAGLPAFQEKSPEAYAREGYTRNSVAFSCINKIAKSAASVPLQVFEKKGDEETLLQDTELGALLNRPNPVTSGAAFIEALLAFKLISGNSYIVRSDTTDAKLNKPPRELWLLRPDLTRVLKGPINIPSAYEHGSGHNKVKFPVDQLTGKSDVLHIRTFHPLDDWHGLSPMAPTAYSIDTVNAVMQWNKALLDNAGCPTGALVMKDKDGEQVELSDEQVARLREQIDNMFTGARNAGRPLLLEGGLEWQSMSHAPKDMDFNNSMLANMRAVAAGYGVPHQLIGIPGGDTYNNLSEAKLTLWADTVLPELDYTLDALNCWLAPQFGENLVIRYDENAIPALEPRRQEKFERVNSSNVLTINEKRRMLGLEDVDGGDVLLVPTGQVPVSMIGMDDPAFSDENTN